MGLWVNERQCVFAFFPFDIVCWRPAHSSKRRSVDVFLLLDAESCWSWCGPSVFHVDYWAAGIQLFANVSPLSGCDVCLVDLDVAWILLGAGGADL